MTLNTETVEQRWDRRDAALQRRLAEIPSRFTNEDLYKKKPVGTVTPEAECYGNNFKFLQKCLRKAAGKALSEWYSGQWWRQEQVQGDLENDLWVWYLTAPDTQRKLANLSAPEAVETFRRAATQQLSSYQLASNTFDGRNTFSSEAVKDALKGRSSNKYLRTILPMAMSDLADKTPQYAQAIRNRYQAGVVPEQGKDAEKLRAAHKALTDQVNVIYLTADDGGTGSRNSLFPELRKVKGDNSDPTGNMAVQLIERPYEYETGANLRDEHLRETPVAQLVYGQQSEPCIDLGDGIKFRPQRVQLV